VKKSTARSPFPWFGGKQKLADTILALFPEHNVYVEVFGGGASVLLSKAPGKLDVYNDADDGLVNFFRCLRDRPDELVPLLELTPYARAEWELARTTWKAIDDDIERARLWYVIVAGSFAGFAARDNGDAGRGWGGERLGRMHLSRAASTANRVDNIWRFVERLRLVQIDNLDWRRCLDRYDDPDALFYIDPPYVPETRRAGGYLHELTADDHAELIERVLALRGVAIVSGYEHELYAPLVERGGFVRHEFGVWSTAARGSKGQARDRRVEVVWASPRAAHRTLFHAAEAIA
jgi:DNA adenine methylase